MMGHREDSGRPDAWEAATRDGARRAQLRRSLELTIRERLEVLEGLWETSHRLVRLGEGARTRDDAAEAASRESTRPDLARTEGDGRT